VDRARFVRENTVLSAPTHVPEIRLHLASEALDLWQKTEDELAEAGLPPPFWAFAWAGGQALARYVLDHPAVVGGRRVLDVGAGGGIAAIAAALAGGRVTASEIDAFAQEAIRLNAAANGARVAILAGDVLDGTTDADVVLVGDLFYEKGLAERTLAFIRRAREAGAEVLVGDPKRSYLPAGVFTSVATYAVPVPLALEDMDVKKTTVWRLP
jgi:predicted nicotinamide N-methyase